MTSSNSPLRVDFVAADKVPAPGRIGLTIAPGKIDDGRGWHRDLSADLQRLKSEYQTDVLVSLMEAHEYEFLGIPNLRAEAEALGMRTIWFPIVDVDAPAANEMAAFAVMIDDLVAVIRNGGTVVIHCRGGLGRSGTVAAACLVRLGLSDSEAMVAIWTARPGAIEVASQKEWVTRYGQRAADPNTAIDELLAFLPVFDARGFKAVESWSGGETSPGVLVWPHPRYASEVARFERVASQDFWQDYGYVPKEVGEWFEKPGFIERASLAEIKSMLTFIIRGERFCDGHIEGMIEAGHVVALLRRLAVIRAELGGAPTAS